jgi:rare lipoprotein A
MTRQAFRRATISTACLALLVIGAGCASSPSGRSVATAPPETGLASYYHDRFHGRTTASGDVYDRDALTAAHRSLPFGTRVLVRNLDNGKSIQLTINDRGPFVKGRILDVSRRAARTLAFVEKGLARVSVKIVQPAREAR